MLHFNLEKFFTGKCIESDYKSGEPIDESPVNANIGSSSRSEQCYSSIPGIYGENFWKIYLILKRKQFVQHQNDYAKTTMGRMSFMVTLVGLAIFGNKGQNRKRNGQYVRTINLFPGGNILLDEFIPSSRSAVKKLQAGLKRLSKVVARVSHKELVLEVFHGNSGRQRSLVLLRVNLNERSLLARDPRESVDNFLGGIVLGSGQDLLVLQLILMLKSGPHEKTFSS